MTHHVSVPVSAKRRCTYISHNGSMAELGLRMVSTHAVQKEETPSHSCVVAGPGHRSQYDRPTALLLGPQAGPRGLLLVSPKKGKRAARDFASQQFNPDQSQCRFRQI